MKVSGYAIRSARGRLEPIEYSIDPGPEDVVVSVTHCGICHSDVHLADGDWGEVFPLVPGHEIVGTVEHAGTSARIEVGARVGVGWQSGSCGACEWCASGNEVFCKDHEATCMGRHGGFAERVVANWRFAVPLPPSVDSAAAAPLFCGGITVYTPLRTYAGPGRRVAVVGIGGLGHLALQFARAMACEVTAISTSPDKEKDAREFGAKEFIVGTPPANAFDLIINTVHVPVDVEALLDALRPKGVLCQVGAVDEALAVPAMRLIPECKSIAGSAIGHPRVLREMLDLAARHGIAARVETMPFTQANDALNRTRHHTPRYRIVLAR
jgi:uncharacterized zinc-type alcohol dehydrogenase-like protein